MTRSELAKKLGVDDAIVKKIFEEIKEQIKAGNSVNIPDFGSFQAINKAARVARNPRTGEAVQVPAKKAAKFKISKAFKDALN